MFSWYWFVNALMQVCLPIYLPIFRNQKICTRSFYAVFCFFHYSSRYSHIISTVGENLLGKLYNKEGPCFPILGAPSEARYSGGTYGARAPSTSFLSTWRYSVTLHFHYIRLCYVLLLLLFIRWSFGIITWIRGFHPCLNPGFGLFYHAGKTEIFFSFIYFSLLDICDLLG